MIKEVLNLLIPRFVTERVAVRHEGNTVIVVRREDKLRPEDAYDYISVIKYFNFFGLGLFAKLRVRS